MNKKKGNNICVSLPTYHLTSASTDLSFFVYGVNMNPEAGNRGEVLVTGTAGVLLSPHPHVIHKAVCAQLHECIEHQAAVWTWVMNLLLVTFCQMCLDVLYNNN